MNKAYIFELRGKILKGDKQAKKEMAEIYVGIFPHNKFLAEELSETNMKTMFLHLDQHFKK